MEKKLYRVRTIYGSGENASEAKERYHHIQDGGVNDLIKSWQEKQPPRDWLVASPSRLLTCPRVVWLHNQGVKPTNPMTWALKQRMLLGRLAENLFADQFKDEGILLHHWKDDPGTEVGKFTLGEGLDRLEGVPDFLLKLDGKVAVSDAKTSRSDSFGFVPLEEDVWDDWGWYKYRTQLTAYYMLCHENIGKLIDLGIQRKGIGLKSVSPEVCHLFSYALDDGVVRREFTWKPTEEDMTTVKRLTRRFNEAVASKTMPKCTCPDSYDGFDVKFCSFGIKEPGEKVCAECCSDDLEPKEVKLAAK